VDVWRNKWRKNGEHSAGVCSPAQQISARIFPYNHHHTQSHIMAITGSSIRQTTRTSALDTQTPLQIRRSTQDNSGVPGCRLENRCSIPGVERDFFSVLKSIKTGYGYDLGSYSTGTRSLYSLRKTAGAWSLTLTSTECRG